MGLESQHAISKYWMITKSKGCNMSSHFSRREFIDGARVVAASSIFGTPAFHGLTPAHRSERMETEELRSKLRGVIAFPITPLKPDLSLDIPGLRKNLLRLLETPVAAIVAAGGTGEMYSLTPAEHLEIVKTTAEELVMIQVQKKSGTRKIPSEIAPPVGVSDVTWRRRVRASATKAVPIDTGTNKATKINKRQTVRRPLGPFQTECKNGARSLIPCDEITFLT